MKKAAYFIIAYLLGFCASSTAQNPYIRHYTTRDGFPTNTIYQMYQDSQKFIWFTSDAGVVKFDGSNLTVYRKKDGLSSNDAVRIKEDWKGRIWIFNYNGSVNYIYNNKVYNGSNAPFLNSLMGRGFILDFYTDSNKSIYFYNYPGDVFSLDKNNTVFKDVFLNNIEPVMPIVGRNLTKGKVSFINKSSSNEWIVWGTFGIYKQDLSKKNNFIIIDSSSQVRAVYLASNNKCYVNTNKNELFKVSANFHKERMFSPCDPFKIKTILEDSEGYLWITAYDEGVYCLKDNKVIKHFDIKDALGLLQDHEQNIWISTQSDGIYVINHDLLEQKHFDLRYFDNQKVNLLCDYPGKGILCTNTEKAFLFNNDIFFRLRVPKIVQPIQLLYLFENETLMLGTLNTKISLLENITMNKLSKEIKYKKIKTYFVHTKKIIKNDSGSELALFDQNAVLFIRADRPSLNEKFSWTNERINNAYYNAKNEFVINAKKNYLYKNHKLEPYPDLSRFDGTVITNHLVLDDSTELLNIDGDSLYIIKEHKIYNMTKYFDFPVDLQINNFLYIDSTLYFTTLRDVYICHNPQKIISGFPIHIEPINISFSNINDILIKKDTLYIASDDGLTIMPKVNPINRKSIPPIPYLKSIVVNDSLFTISDSKQGLKLTGNNNIQLSFGCISYSASSIIYSYILVGAENNWTIETGNGVNLVYKNLPKGNYIFKLKVRKSNSGWSEPLEIPITIKPTLVEYPAFWALIVLLSTGFLFLIISIIRKQKMKRVEVDHQLIVMEQKALQSMMNPHFIFNSLGSIQNFLLKNKGSEAVIYLSQFAHLIRQNLNAVNTPMINLEEEVDRLKRYIDLEKRRLDNNFEYSIEIDKKIEEDEVYIPSMIIQPIVENSIWHGIATLEKKGSIKISFQAFKSKSIKIVIEDNGIGIKKSHEFSTINSHHKHLGMQIIKKRLDLLNKKYKTETSIIYSESSLNPKNPGTKVELVLPFVHNIDTF